MLSLAPGQVPTLLDATLRQALSQYKKKTGKELLDHSLATELKRCSTVDAVLEILQGQASAFQRSRDGDRRLINWISPVVDVLYKLSDTICGAGSLAIAPAGVIFTGIGVLLAAAKDVRASHDALVELFERIESSFKSIGVYTLSFTSEMAEVFMKIVTEVLSILSIATKEVNRRRSKIYFGKLLGRTDIEGSLHKLDGLIQEGVRVAMAQAMKVTIKDDTKKADVAINMDEIKWNEVEHDIRKWLSPPNPSTNHHTACKVSHNTPPTRFFGTRVFKDWMSNGSLLWIHGKPGSGKSILCSAIIQYIIAQRDAGRATLAYFYFDFRDEEKQNVRNVVTSLLVQLSSYSNPCYEIIHRLYSTFGEGRQQPRNDILIHCLEEMLAVLSQHPIFVILDALNDCPDSGTPTPREEVLHFVKNLVHLQLPNLHICVTSRLEVDIQTELKPLAFHAISLHTQTWQKILIATYLDSVVSSDERIKQWREEDKKMVVKELSESASGIFQWVFCHLESLRSAVRSSLRIDVRGIVEKLPKTLDETYERVLKTIHDNNRKYARRLLYCLAVSVRPLRVEELAEILTFDFGTSEEGIPRFHPDWRPKNQEGAILSTCSSLVAIVDIGDSRVVQFSHRTVKDFLTSTYLASSVGSLSSNYILPGRAHTILAQVCLGLLLHLDGRNYDNNVKGSPLAEYAARHWVEHTQFEDVASRVEDGIKSLFDLDKPHFATWVRLYDMDSGSCGRTPPEIPSPLYYSSLCGFYGLVEHIATKHPQHVNAIGGSYGFALAAALCRNHYLVAELLLEHGGSIDVLDTRKQTALHVTIDRQDKAAIGAVRFLLEHGADVNVRRDDLWTPLHLAVNIGDLSLTRVLLTRGADVNARNSDGQSPLHLLARRETFQDEDGSDIAGLLLEYGADMNLEDKDNATPLHLASYNEKFKIVRVLLDHVEKDQRETPMQRVLKGNLGDGNNIKHHHSRSSTPDSRSSSPTPPPTAAYGSLRSFGVGELSPVGDAAVNATQPAISMPSPAPQAVTGARTSLPADSPGATNSAARVPLTTSPSPSPSPATLRAFPGRNGGRKLGGDGALTPASTWWTNSKRKRTIPIEQAEGYAHIRSRVIEAVGDALGVAASIGHEALFTGVDLLQFVPVPGLNTAGTILLNIWDAIEMVETNRQASLRLAERCADILVSIRSELADAGYTVAEELRRPIAKLVEAFEEVHHFLSKFGKRPFLKRYLGRNEILTGISACDTALKDALEMFDRSIQLRTLKLIQTNELQRQKETQVLLESLSHVSPGLPPAHLTSPPLALRSSPADPESVHSTLHALLASQNAKDRAYDMADLHQLMRAALAANDDVAMIEVLQIARSEMPEAIKTLERALERLVEDRELDTESTMALPSQYEEAGKANDPFVDLGNSGASHSSVDTLDREFIETGIDALRRLSKGVDLGLPSWTITRFEIDLDAKVGVGFFSDVYRGTWRKHTVAVKVLSETTPRKIFLREVGIWKSLYHPNVLELFGASSASGEPPWFLVSKYYPRGNLVKYLKGLSDADAAGVDASKMIHEISKGMAYLHKQGVLHGDLKATNILVDDDTRCVISDFGQSEMKSEVYRITGASRPCGTLRWQAPELMQGAQALTQEMDVYAFAICCGEILTMGALPWPFMDDYAVRHSVLNENMRPSLPPPSNLVNDQLINVIRASWDRFPSNRPSFEQIARELKKQRAGRNAHSINSQTSPD